MPTLLGPLESANLNQLDLFPSSGEGREMPTLLGPLERANLNRRAMEKIQNPMTVIHYRQNSSESTQ
jgi:hypothetical protein